MNMNYKKSILKLYVLEFILSLFFVFSLTYIIYKINYSNFSPVNLIVFFLMNICLFYICWIIYYNIKNNIGQWHKIFVVLMIPVGMLYCFFLIPGQAPDEDAHYYRAYEISTGVFISGVDETSKDIVMSIPADLYNFNRRSVSNYYQLVNNMFRKSNYTNSITTNSLTQSYSPILYIFPAISFIISRILQLNVVWALYLGRLFNFILFLLIGYYSIKNIPFGKVLLFTYFFIPMLIHQAVAISNDSITNCVLIYFVSYVLKLYFIESNIQIKDKIKFIVLSMLVALSKTAYSPIILISLILLVKKDSSSKKIFSKKNSYIFLGIFVCFAISIAWFLFLNNYKTYDATTYVENQYLIDVFSVLKSPVHFFKALFNTFGMVDKYIDSNYYIKTFIGSRLGWLDIRINSLIVFSYLFLLLVSPFLEKHNFQLNTKQKILFISIFLICAVLIFLALYLSWNNTIAFYVEGIQGRYFIPIVILLLLCMCYKNKHILFKNLNFYYPLIILLLNILVIVQIILHFI